VIRLVFPLALLLAACTNPEPDKDAVVRKAKEVSAIHIHSLPPGCFVELNNEFMGATPMTIRVPSYEGDWSGDLGNTTSCASAFRRAAATTKSFGEPVTLCPSGCSSGSPALSAGITP
jgi:hypothetical protein